MALLQELKRYQISSEQLERTVAQCQLPRTTFACKLEELSRLYLQYEAFLAQDYLDSEDVLELWKNNAAPGMPNQPPAASAPVSNTYPPVAPVSWRSYPDFICNMKHFWHRTIWTVRMCWSFS